MIGFQIDNEMNSNAHFLLICALHSIQMHFSMHSYFNAQSHSFLAPHSSLLTLHFSILTPHFSTLHFSFIILHSSLFTFHWSFLTVYFLFLPLSCLRFTFHYSFLTMHFSLSSLLIAHSSHRLTLLTHSGWNREWDVHVTATAFTKRIIIHLNGFLLYRNFYKLLEVSHNIKTTFLHKKLN